MKIFNKKKEFDDDVDADWRNLNALPREVVSKKELDSLQKEVINELEALQRETVAQIGDRATAKPQTLYYYHKYIDAKFNKGDFDVDTYFTQKQNIVDQKYAEGLGDIRAEFTGYKELLDEIREADQRLRRKINKLDPSSDIGLDSVGTYDDSVRLLEVINELPEEINWNEFEEK